MKEGRRACDIIEPHFAVSKRYFDTFAGNRIDFISFPIDFQGLGGY